MSFTRMCRLRVNVTLGLFTRRWKIVILRRVIIVLYLLIVVVVRQVVRKKARLPVGRPQGHGFRLALCRLTEFGRRHLKPRMILPKFIRSSLVKIGICRGVILYPRRCPLRLLFRLLIGSRMVPVLSRLCSISVVRRSMFIWWTVMIRRRLVVIWKVSPKMWMKPLSLKSLLLASFRVVLRKRLRCRSRSCRLSPRFMSILTIVILKRRFRFVRRKSMLMTTIVMILRMVFRLAKNPSTFMTKVVILLSMSRFVVRKRVSPRSRRQSLFRLLSRRLRWR